MTAQSGSTPLVAIDAVVLDTETTGLDSRSARIVQIGALRIRGKRIEQGARFERLVNPGIPIPPATTAVHGLTDGMLAGAPTFVQLVAELEAFIGAAIVIGHSVLYDLAVLEREYRAAGLTWTPRAALDTRVLARLASPTLAHYDLDRLCQWLGIAITGRHSALGDAEATAKVFVALLPLLRQRGIRTLAEAEAASREQFDREVAAAGGRLPQPTIAAAADRAVPLVKVDSYPYRRRVRDVMSRPAVTAAIDMGALDAVRLMLERKVSAVFVTGGPATGIVTERDIMRALAAHGAQAVDVHLGAIMTASLETVREDDFLYRAIGRMARMRFRHLAVVDPQGEITGGVSMRDLLRYRSTSAIMLGDEIETAGGTVGLAAAWAKVPAMARGLIEEGVAGRAIAAVISAEICALTRRAAEIGEARLLLAGRGPPPVPYAVLVLGSAGRGESLLAPDQDHAIVYESGAPGGPEDQWFEALGGHISDILDQVGVPYCKGGVMAKNAAWRHSLAGWKELIDGWVSKKRPEDLLNVDIFFDCVSVHGQLGLGEEVRDHAFERAHKARHFLFLLAEAARQWRAPLRLLGGIKAEAGRVDLKKGGLLPICTGARVLALRHNIRDRWTPDRLKGVAELGVGSARDIDAVIEAHRTILRTVLEQQLADLEAGVPPSTKVALDWLQKERKQALKEALGKVAIIVDMVGEGRI